MKPVVLLIMMLSAVGLDATVTKKAETKEAQDKHTTPTPNKEPQTLSRGWGDDLDWCQTYEEGLAKAKEEQKTLMVIHHLEDCPYSQALKKAFTSHPEIQKLAKKFIMLNLVYPPTDKNQAPDGYYVPRIIFVDCFSTVRADIAGRYYNRLYTYEPDDMDILYANMKRALIPYHTEL